MTFEPLISIWLIILIVVPVTLLFVGLEIRKSHSFRVLRIVSMLIMMTALAMILLKPKIYLEKSFGIILLTTGYAPQQVDSILSRHARPTLMHLKNVAPYKNSKQFVSYELPRRSAEIRFVLGEGLSSFDLDRMDSKNFYFFPAKFPTGITALFVSSENMVHRQNIISGTYNNIGGNVWISLEGPAGKEDSVLLKGKGQHRFQLSFVPKQSGNFIYSVLVKDSTITHQENLPIHIEEERSLSILFLQHYPTFETQYLKTFLQNKKQSIVLRYQVSKNNFRYEFINHDRILLDRLTNELLEKMDLVITDSESLSRLSSIEKNHLEKSIQSGLGLLLLSPANNKLPRTFFPFSTHAFKNDTTSIIINEKAFTFPVPRFSVTEKPFVTSILKNRSGVLAGYTFKGAGKIGFQLLQESYPLTLSGDSSAYAELWSPLLEHLARPQRSASKIKILTPFPWLEDEPIDTEIISLTDNTSLTVDSVTIPLKEDINIDNVWYGRTWAGNPGWHMLTSSDGSTLNYFISKPNEWKSLFLTNQIMANALVSKPKAETKSIHAWEEIPLVIFYLTFLISAGILWLTPKL